MSIDKILDKYTNIYSSDFDFVESLVEEGLICYDDLENINLNEFDKIDEISLGTLLGNPVVKGIALNVATSVGTSLLNGGFEKIIKKISQKHSADTEHCEDLSGEDKHACIKKANIYYLTNKLKVYNKLYKECSNSNKEKIKKECQLKVKEQMSKIKERLHYYSNIF